MTTAIVFMAVCLFGYALAFISGPVWGLLVYANIYFNVPNPDVNWWALYLPFHRWSLLSSVILIVSVVRHKSELSKFRLSIFKWAILFFILSCFVTFAYAITPDDAKQYLYALLTYCVIGYLIIKIVKNIEIYRLFIIGIIALATHLSLNAYLYGDRIHARLENIGAADTVGSNEFGLLLAGIIPLIIPFVFYGKWYERIISIIAIPFLFNAFILCNSRGSFVALAAAFLLAFFIVADNKVRKIMIIGAIIAFPLFIYLSDDAFVNRLSSLTGTGAAMQDTDNMATLSSGRTQIWMYGVQMVKDYPFGAGPNGFKQLARFYMPYEILTFHPGAEYGVRAAHNSYLQVLVEQGYLGLCIWVSMCLHTAHLLFTSSRRLQKKSGSNPFLTYSVFALNVSFFSILVGGLVNSRIYYEFFWWQLALSVVVSNLSKEFLGEDGSSGTDELSTGMASSDLCLEAKRR